MQRQKSTALADATLVWQLSEITAQNNYSLAAAIAERLYATALAGITKSHTLSVAAETAVLDTSYAAANAQYWALEVAASNAEHAAIAQADAAYWSADTAQTVTALSGLHTALGLPWTQYLVDWAGARQAWWEAVEPDYLDWVSERNLAKSAYQNVVSTAYLSKATAIASATFTRATEVATETEARDLEYALAQEAYVKYLSGQPNIEGPAGEYARNAASARRDYAVAVAQAKRNYAVNQNQAAYQAALDAALTAEEDWLDTAHDEYAAEEGFAVSSRMVLQVTADYELALATIAAEVDETAEIAAATRTYKVAESNANLTLSTQWASLAKAYWILEATELSCRMTSLESTNGSPWAAYAADEAAAQLAWVSSTAVARETYHVTLAEEQDMYATERANLDESQANDLQAINADYDTAAWNAHLQRTYDQAYLILEADSDYPASGPAVPKPPSLGGEYAVPAAPIADYASPASRSSPRVYTVWNWYPYAYWGYYGYYGYYGYGSQWNDYYYWSYATYPHEAASYSGYDAGLSQLRNPRELDLEDYWRINRRGKNYWDLAGKSDEVTVTTVWDLADRYDVVWGEQGSVDPNPDVELPPLAAAAAPGTMAEPTTANSAPGLAFVTRFAGAAAPEAGSPESSGASGIPGSGRFLSDGFINASYMPADGTATNTGQQNTSATSNGTGQSPTVMPLQIQPTATVADIETLVAAGLAEKVKGGRGNSDVVVVRLSLPEGKILNLVYEYVKASPLVFGEFHVRWEPEHYTFRGSGGCGYDTPARVLAGAFVWGQQDQARKNGIEAIATFFLHVVPTGAAIDHAMQGNKGEAVASAVGDIALGLGAFAKVTSGAKALWMARGAMAVEAGVGLYRSHQSVTFFADGDYAAGAGAAGEAVLRLFGVTAQSLKSLKRAGSGIEAGGGVARAAPNTGFGVSGLLSKIEKGVPDKTIQEFYQAAASSPLFKKKLGLANLLSGGKKVSVDDILLELQKNSKFRRIESLGNARIDVTQNGTFVFRHSADTGVFSRATAHHELLHLAQFIRNPSVKTSARNLSFLQRQLYEPIPALIGSPEIFGVPTLIVTGTGAYVVYESSGLIFELLDE